MQWEWAICGKTHDVSARSRGVIEEVDQRRHPAKSRVLDGACRCAERSRGQGRRRMFRPNDCRCPERDRASDGSAEVLRILNAVEGDGQQIRVREHLRRRGHRERWCPCGCPLVSRSSGQLIQYPTRDPFDFRHTLGLGEPRQGVEATPGVTRGVLDENAAKGRTVDAYGLAHRLQPEHQSRCRRMRRLDHCSRPGLKRRAPPVATVHRPGTRDECAGSTLRNTSTTGRRVCSCRLPSASGSCCRCYRCCCFLHS